MFYSPNITFPKFIAGFSTSIKAFLHVQMSGMSIWPVSLRIGNTEFMSSFNYGVKVIVIVVDRPADIRPDGVYCIWKKSLILSSKGSSLNELKEKETFVNRIVYVCETPTVKSLKMILSGLEMKAVPLNSRPATICGLTMPSFYRMRAFSMYSCSSKESFGSHCDTNCAKVKFSSVIHFN